MFWPGKGAYGLWVDNFKNKIPYYQSLKIERKISIIFGSF